MHCLIYSVHISIYNNMLPTYSQGVKLNAATCAHINIMPCISILQELMCLALVVKIGLIAQGCRNSNRTCSVPPLLAAIHLRCSLSHMLCIAVPN